MEVLNLLETANFLKLTKNKDGKELTDKQKIDKIIELLQNKTLPGDVTAQLDDEIIIIKDRLEEYLSYLNMKQKYGNGYETNCKTFNQETSGIPRMRTIKETAKITKVPEGQIRQLVKQNKIDFFQCGNKKVLINLDKFVTFLNTSNITLKAKDNKYGIERIEL